MTKKREPKKTPTKLRVLRGNPGRRPLPENEPAPISGDHPPAYLLVAEKKWWRRHAPAFERLGLLTEADESMFAMLCRRLAGAAELEKDIRKHGWSYQTPNGIWRPRPEVKMLQDCRKHIVSIWSEFGGSPSSRAKLAKNLE